jgi:hypothetical protein
MCVSAGPDSAMAGMVADGNSWRLWDGSRKMNGRRFDSVGR